MFVRFIMLLALLGASAGAINGAPNPARFEKDIAAFEARDRTHSPPEGGVLFVGSSTIRLWKSLSSDFPDLNVIGRGFGGSHIPDSTYFADRIVIPYRPSKIVLYAGDNDITGGASPERVFQDFRGFVDKVRAALPETRIYFLAIKPSPARWHLSPQAAEANRLIRRYCRLRPKLEYIDLWKPMIGENGQPDDRYFDKDRLHLNDAGYELWAKIVREALKD